MTVQAESMTDVVIESPTEAEVSPDEKQEAQTEAEGSKPVEGSDKEEKKEN